MKLNLLASLYYRCRWLHAPTALLIVLFQRTPVVRVVAQMEAFFGPNAATVLRSGFIVSAMGAYNSVAGATALSATPVSPASAKTGTAFTLKATYKGAPSNPASMQVVGTLPPGLSAVGANASGVVNGTPPIGAVLTISGTPTYPGTYTFSIVGWEGLDATFRSKTTAYTIKVTGTASPAPSFTVQPTGQTVKAGAALTLSVTAVGTPAPTLQWRKDNVDIPGATSASYVIPSFSASDVASYTVVATNSVGTTTSNAAALTLAVLPVFPYPLYSQNINLGDAIALYAYATGVPEPTYKWKLNGTDIPGATSSSLYIPVSTAGNAGNYTVVATNAAGSTTSNTAVVTVKAVPVITKQPVAQTAKVGGSVTFTVTATSTKTIGYQWYKNSTFISGATSASYAIPSVTTGSAASYKVVVSNSDGSVTSAAVALTVQSPPVVSVPPAALTVKLGASAGFAVTTVANPLTATYQWRKDGVVVAKTTVPSYTIAKTAATSGGLYDVVITNLAGSVTSATARLTVLVAPAITGQLKATTVAAGQSATLTVVATGSPTPTYQWYKNLVAIPGATSASYSISSAVASQAGSYTVVVTNSAGSVTSLPAIVTVDVSPKLLAAGSTFYLTGSASGSAPFTVADTITVYSKTLLSYTDDHAAPAKVGSATGVYAKVGALGATLKGTYTGIGSTATYALTLTFSSPTAGTYINTHVSSAKVTTTDRGAFTLGLPPATPPVPPTTLAVGKTLRLTGSGTDSGGNYVVNSTDVVTSATQATLTDATVYPATSATIGFVYAKPVGTLASAKTTVTVGGATATSTIQLLFSTATGGSFFTTGKDAGGVFYEEGSFTLTP